MIRVISGRTVGVALRGHPRFPSTLGRPRRAAPTVVFNELNQSTSQEIEGGLRGAPANEISITRQVEPPMLRLDIVGKRDEDCSHWLLVSAATRSGNSRDRQSEIRANTRANPFRHRLRD